MLPLYFAPLQGYTDAAFRRLHHQLVGGVDAYFTPFVRLERGEVRNKDLRDIDREANSGVPVVPQIIVKDRDELCRLTEVVVEKSGSTRIDINMGCAFPLQTRLGRGCALLCQTEQLEGIAREIERRKEVQYSIKMRLGHDDKSECLTALEVLGDTPLTHIAVHVRTGRMQFTGRPDTETFDRLTMVCRHPLILNGDLNTLEELQEAERRWPMLAGLMVGRGLLADPLLGCEYRQGHACTEPERIGAMLRLHDAVYEHAQKTLQGAAQTLSRMHAFWEYERGLLPVKHHKKLMKSNTIIQYEEALAPLRRLC